ncbi:VCBS domain-containing protein [Gallaecimonas sp. GXIMD4217]|uniref:VCBS domain-containing protein n=1 Tax=Gallaecimonas sp. GXIMD4217 TaxID=3131927 RepID=UPI00311B43B4
MEQKEQQISRKLDSDAVAGAGKESLGGAPLESGAQAFPEQAESQDGLAALSELEQIQSAIISGDDPTAELPAPEAGSTAPQGNEGGDFVSLSRSGAETLASAGYDSALNPPTSADAVTVANLDVTDAEPVIGNGIGNVVEDLQLVTGGTIAASDEDNLELAFVAGEQSNEFGTFTVNAAGEWSFVLDNDAEAVQALADGEEVVREFTVTLTDGSTTVVTVTIEGSDDLPVISSDAGAVEEDVTLSTGGELTATDVDNPDLAFVAGSQANEYGTFTVNAAGEWSFVLDNDAEAVQALAEGEEVVREFTVTLTDGSTTIVTVTITGSDDLPVISSDAGAVQEDVTLTTGGELTATDVDNPDLAFVAGEQSNEYGTFTVNAAGEWSFVLDNDAEAVQALAEGEEVVREFTVTLTDGSTTIVTVTITGSDDLPVISSDAGAVQEDVTLTTGGELTATDVDNPDLAFVAGEQSNEYGTFTVDENGVWSFVLDNDAEAVQALADGEEVVREFTVTLTDGSTTVVTVTIEGSDDLPVISNGAGAVEEDVTLSTGGELTATDVDNPDLAFVVGEQANEYGTFTVDENGVWSFVLDNDAEAVQALAEGEEVVREFTVTLTDGSTTVVTVTIEGSDDAPVISSDAGAVQEDVTLTTGGELTATDVDNPELAFVVGEQANEYGTFTVDENGVWSFVLDNDAEAVQALAEGEEVVREFTVTLTDGSTTVVTVTIEGSDDAPVISSDAGAVQEDVTLTTGGELTATDVDNPELAFVAGEQSNEYGTFSVDENGVWSFVLDNDAEAVQALAEGEEVVREFTVTLSDGSTTIVTVTITGSDDAPVISSDAGAVQEDVTLTTGGELTATDVDNPELAFVAGEQSNEYGTFSVDENGVWSFVLDNDAEAVQALAEGEEVVREFTVTLNDGSTTVVTVTIEGSDDLPVISSDAGAVEEDVTLTTGGELTATDVDNPELAFVAGEQSNEYGTFTVDENGVWSFVLDNDAEAVQALAEGEEVVREFTVTLTDGSTTVVTVTIEGSDDLPVISSDAGAVQEDVTLTTGGELTATDVDNPDLAFVAGEQANEYGTFSVDENGVWSFVLDNDAEAVQALAEGEEVVREFTVTLSDGSTTIVTVTIEGSDDLPVISSDAGAVEEDVTLSTGGELTATDVDNPDLAFVAGEQSNEYGTFTVDENGVWSFVLDNDAEAVQALAEGEEVVREFTVTLNDGSTTVVTVTITGSDDAPVISSDAGAVEEDVTLTTGGELTATDVDNPDLAFVAGEQANEYGTFTVDENGVWSFVLDNDAEAVQALAEGEEVVREFTVTLNDGSTTVVTVTISGSDDLPVISSDAGAVEEDVTLSTGGELTATDVDNPDLAFVAGEQTNEYGTFTVDENGVWSFALDNDAEAVQALAEGEEVVREFTVTLTDGSTTVVTVTIEGSDDLPVISSDAGAVEEDVTLTTGGELTATDVDNPELAFVAGEQSNEYGTFTVDENGVWSFVLDNDAEAVQALAEGEEVVREFTVTLTDGSTTVVTVTIEGSDDLPVISSDAGAVQEDVTLTTGGELTATDVDNPDLAFVAGEQSNEYGTFTVDENGVWSFVLDNDAEAVQALAEGEEVVREFTVTLTDGSTTIVIVTITGSDDLPVISNDAGAVQEDVTLSTGGELTATDVDNPDLAFVAGEQSNEYGTFSVDENGVWSFVLDNDAEAVQALAEGEEVVREFTVTLNDGSTTVVTVTISGSDDLPVISSDAGAVEEDVTLSTGGELTATDVDNPDLAFVAGEQSNEYGTFSVDENGVWSFVLDNDAEAVQALAEGEEVVREFTVTLTDGSTTVVTVTIEGSDDLPVISSDAGAVQEDVTLTTGGELTATDVDNPDLAFVAGEQSNEYGTFTVDENGVWSFVLDNDAEAVQALAEGEEVVREFTVTLTDGSTTVVTVTITGSGELTGGDAVILNLDEAQTRDGSTGSEVATLAFTAGGEAITGFAFGDTSGIQIQGLNGQLTWTQDGDGNLIGSLNGTDLIKLSLAGGAIAAGDAGSVAVTAQLLDNLPHDASVDNLTISGIKVVASEADGDSAEGTVTVHVADDQVVADAQDLQGSNAPGTYTGTLDTQGADDNYSADLSGNVSGWNGTDVTFADSGETSGGLTIYYHVDPANPGVLIAYTNSSENPGPYTGNGNQSVVFELTADPNSDSYQLNMVGTIDVVVERTIAQLGDGPNSPVQERYVDDQGNVTDAPNDNLVFTLHGRDSSGSLKVNGKNGGYGVDNPIVGGQHNADEVLTIDFQQDVASAAIYMTTTGNGTASCHYKAYGTRADGSFGLLGEGDIQNGDVIGDIGAISYIELTSNSKEGFSFTGTSLGVIESIAGDVQLNFDVAVTDSDGDTSSDSFVVDLQASEPVAPEALSSLVSLGVDEAILYRSGSEQDLDTLSFKAGSEAINAFAFGDTDAIQVAGTNASVHWQLNDQGELVGTLQGREAIKLSLDWDDIAAGSEGEVQVKAELLDAFPHNIDVNELSISGIKVVAADRTGATAESEVEVTVIDDVRAQANDDTGNVLNVQMPAINLAIALDTSGSMEGRRLADAKAAVKAMLASYAELGTQVTVAFYEFWEGPSYKGEFSFSASSDGDYIELLEVIDALYSGGGTSYSVLDAMDAWLSAQDASDAITKAYFISDGNPGSDHGTELDQYLANWSAFLAEHPEVAAHAIGIGNGISDTYLDQIDSSGDAIMLADSGDLSQTLQDLVPQVAVEGNVLANDDLGADGADHISQVGYGDQSFKVLANGNLVISGQGDASGSYDADSQQLTIVTGHGTLSLFLGGEQLGEFRYVSNGDSVVTEDVQEVFQYQLVDGDGDASSANLVVTLTSGGDDANWFPSSFAGVDLAQQSSAPAPEAMLSEDNELELLLPSSPVPSALGSEAQGGGGSELTDGIELLVAPQSGAGAPGAMDLAMLVPQDEHII